MSRPRAGRSRDNEPAQLPLPTPSLPKPKRKVPMPEEIAKSSIAKRGKPSAVPGDVNLTVTLDVERTLAERFVAQAVREGVNLEAIVVEALQAF